ncbi:site-specific integrase [Ornithinibacillus gellani]|uniref:site-specific integrase n=1 Tax=Ornithinibacillus gellani TaxID=2293253 RepID=UPI000F4A1514|nr:site-specific integrase [Ornithinibacillus gellani]TQS71909.1 site-specific integrase [Ornithinibacillus gellani]
MTGHSNPINFNDKKIKRIVNIFIDKSTRQNYHNFDLSDAYNVIELLEENLDRFSVTWEFFQKLFNKSQDKKIREGICRLVLLFINNDCYYGEFREIVKSFNWSNHLAKELYWLFSNSMLPYNLIVIKKDTKSKNPKIQENNLTCKNDSSTLFLSNLLRDFVMNNHTGSRNHRFYANFQASLNGKPINRVTDFNAETFKQQYYFYKTKEKGSNSITLLKKFYLMLLSYSDGRNILNWKDGLDGNMLQLVSFNKNYEKGFLPIPLNPFDPIPEYDKWLIMPNGLENTTTKINSFSYRPVNFQPTKDEKLKFGLKHWFWNSNTSLPARIDYTQICIKFINFIFDLRNDYSIRKVTSSDERIDSFIVEEVFSYVQFIKGNKMNNSYISVVRGFLTYLQENNLYKIEPSVFKYLVTKTAQVNNTSKDISDELLINIENKLKENSADNYLNTLYYIVFHIAIATEFRISQILNLKISCLVKDVKRDYYLESHSKVSNGKKVKVPITPYTKRYIETAIKFTQDVRDECKNPSIKEQIFIHNNSAYNYKVISVRSFSDYLKRICNQLGIESFTAHNLRDTYMTKSIEYAMKQNMSEMELRALTNHKQLNTTTNHYVAEKIKDYLEATHMVVIGNPTIKGNIVTETDHSNKDLVNENCGYCPYESCIQTKGNLDCLMCSGFIATVDRIPFYEEKIAKIDKDIKSSKSQATRDKHVVVKRLYLAYLEKLLVLKEEKA